MAIIAGALLDLMCQHIWLYDDKRQKMTNLSEIFWSKVARWI